MQSGLWQDSWTATQWQDWGALVAARYKSTPNIIWLVGNDMISPYSDTSCPPSTRGHRHRGHAHLGCLV